METTGQDFREFGSDVQRGRVDDVAGRGPEFDSEAIAAKAEEKRQEELKRKEFRASHAWGARPGTARTEVGQRKPGVQIIGGSTTRGRAPLQSGKPPVIQSRNTAAKAQEASATQVRNIAQDEADQAVRKVDERPYGFEQRGPAMVVTEAPGGWPGIAHIGQHLYYDPDFADMATIPAGATAIADGSGFTGVKRRLILKAGASPAEDVAEWRTWAGAYSSDDGSNENEYDITLYHSPIRIDRF